MSEIELEMADETGPEDYFRIKEGTPERWTPGFDRSKTWYIGGPMTGLPKFNWPAFEQAAGAFRSIGVNVKSAHKVDHGEHTGTGTQPYVEYLRGDLHVLLQCDGLILLKGWTKSKGARLEAEIAMDLEYEVWFFDQYRMIQL